LAYIPQLSVRPSRCRTGLSIANASQHLQHLRRAGLLTSRRQGKFVYYTLADDGILDVLAALRRIAERNSAEVERVVRGYYNKLDKLEPVTRKPRLKANTLSRQSRATCRAGRPDPFRGRPSVSIRASDPRWRSFSLWRRIRPWHLAGWGRFVRFLRGRR
jgi:DNA-binding transcriptional ArsR family regulator